jgi:predicted metalloprotease with PDZ domain
VIRNVVPGSPAWRAGLTFGDEIVAVGGARVTAATFDKRVGDHDPRARVRVAYFRRDVLQEAVVTLATSPERKLIVAADAAANADARAVRARWLAAG